MLEYRVRGRIAPEDMKAMEAKMLTAADVSVMLTGPARVARPDGSPLCVYLPGAISPELREASLPTLRELKGSYTSNRGYAAGTKERVAGQGKRTYAKHVDSAIIGSWERSGPKQFCRLTAWTGREMEQWRGLWPLFERVAECLKENVPERYAAQAREAARTAPEWVIPGTPFTTITVNNTYATAVHTDKGDLEQGFSTIAVFREGDYRGGWLCFPEYRLAVDMQDRDLLLMDAHEWHGNTEFSPKPERNPRGLLVGDPGFERISIVSYFRTNMVKCEDAATEEERRAQYAENRSAALVGE